MGYGIWDMGWDGIWDWDGIMTNGMGQMGFGMGFGWDGIGILPSPLIWVASIIRTAVKLNVHNLIGGSASIIS